MDGSTVSDGSSRARLCCDRGGEGCRTVAARFGVAVSSAVKWSNATGRRGTVAPGKMGGHREKHPGATPDVHHRADRPDLAFDAARTEGRAGGAWGEGVATTRCGSSCAGRGFGSKKDSARRLSRLVADIARRRQRWRSLQAGLDPRRLVFIDETWIKTNMAPLRGWGPRGKRLRGFAPHGHWRTLTFLGALRCDRLAAPCVFDGPINGQCFRAYVEQQLVPVLEPGDIVVMDMCGRPRWRKKNSSKSMERGRVLTCVRPPMRLSRAAGPYGSSQNGSNSISRARGAYP